MVIATPMIIETVENSFYIMICVAKKVSRHLVSEMTAPVSAHLY